ncbi:hypothetical protein AAHA92_20657 [Salvia divinorum]|uniref:Uncharacterized protein n=1 Tax=Salvia divinorum TaxID=28513 RepID=A0ABD1GI97_SALDI
MKDHVGWDSQFSTERNALRQIHPKPKPRNKYGRISDKLLRNNNNNNNRRRYLYILAISSCRYQLKLSAYQWLPQFSQNKSLEEQDKKCVM